MLKDLTEKLIAGHDLSFDLARQAVDTILGGSQSEVAIAGFLTALAAKGECADEVAGMAQALRNHAVKVNPQQRPVLDIVGTGGDGRCTFNISTTSAFVLAGAGVSVAKHGNRAITSKCGAADLLAGLGVKLDAAPETIAQCIDQAGIGFMFAPMHHPAMKFVQPVRKALGFRTVFNILGPLANPACAEWMVIGVARENLLEMMAQALIKLGVKRAMVVSGDGTDELVLSGVNHVIDLAGNETRRYTIEADQLGLAKGDIAQITSDSLENNLKLTRGVLDGTISGVIRNTILLNAAAGFYVAGKCQSVKEGLPLAAKSIDTGAALAALEKMTAISNS